MLITDIRMPDMNGVDVLREAKQIDPAIDGIMMTAFASTETAVEALRLGAVRLREQAVRRRRAEAAGPRGARAQAAAAGERPAQAGAAARRTSSRTSSAAARPMLAVFQLIETIAPTEQHGADHRRVGHRQGARGARDPLQLAAARPAVRRAQLRRASGDAARVGAVRPHARRVHRRRHQQEGADRGRREGARSSSTRSAR